MGQFFKSFTYAFTGVYITFKSERNFRIHIVALFLSAAMGFYLSLSILEWGFIIFSIGFVFVSELFNTAIERLGDKVAGDKQDQLVRNIKDISAAAVLLSALTALIIGIIFLFIPFGVKIFSLL